MYFNKVLLINKDFMLNTTKYLYLFSQSSFIHNI